MPRCASRVSGPKSRKINADHRTQFLKISSTLLVIDQLTKWLVTRMMVPGQSIPLIPSVMHLTYVQNTGAAFGLMKGRQLIFIVMSLLVIGWLGWDMVTRPPVARRPYWGATLIMAGAAGNLIDRLRFGYVTDFLDVRVWPVFNVGDSAITIGVLLLIWHAVQPGTKPER